MTDTVPGLRRAITAATDMHGVVRAMKALAASNVEQFRRSLRAVSEYERTVDLGLGACLRDREAGDAKPEVGGGAKVVDAVVFGSDDGLVGQFNEVVAEEALKAVGGLGPNQRVWAVGARVQDGLADGGVTTAGVWPVPSSAAAIAPLVGRILIACEAPEPAGGLEELHVFYHRLGEDGIPTPVSERVLPLDAAWRKEHIEKPWPSRSVPDVIGGAAPTLRAFVRGYVFVSLFKACAQSLASENQCRLAAMERADKNIKDRLETLAGRFHRVRQTGIDEELFDLVAGFEALSTARDAR